MADLVEADPAPLRRLMAVFDDVDHQVATSWPVARVVILTSCSARWRPRWQPVRSALLDAQRREDGAPGRPDREGIRAASATLRELVHRAIASATP